MDFFDYVKQFFLYILLGLTLLSLIQTLFAPTPIGVLILVVLIIVLLATAIEDDRFYRRRRK